MAFIRCHNCGHTNDAESTFCAKCATSLKRSQLKSRNANRVLIPPQETGRVPVPVKSQATFPSGLLWLIGIMIVGTLLIWFFFSG